MVQRIQTLYLVIVIAALVTISLGINIFSFSSEKADDFELKFSVNVYGAQADAFLPDNMSAEEEEKLKEFLKIKKRTNRVSSQPIITFPFYLISIFMTVLALATLLTYKNLKTQKKLGRLGFITNLSAFVFVVIIYYFSKQQANDLIEDIDVNSSLHFGFYCLVISTAFSFLASTGIKRDLKLIESIDRIR